MKWLISIISVILMASLAVAANKTLFYWTPPTTNVDGTPLTDLSGYKVYCGNSTGNYTIAKDTRMQLPKVSGEVEYLISNVIPAAGDKQWFCALAAYDDAGNESGYSNEISFFLDAVQPDVPTGLGVK